MNSSMIGKIEKAHRYAAEPGRATLNQFEARFHGSHDDYQVTFDGEHWNCTCHTFESHVVGETCAHIMAMQITLGPMLSQAARTGAEPTAIS